MNKSLIAALILTVFVTGYWIAPKELLDEQTSHSGYFTTDTQKILSATVASLREENKLLVYSYKGTATVQTTREMLWLFHGRQKIIVPAVVNYTLDLSDLGLADVGYNSATKTVKVKLPRLTIGDIAFRPEAATTITGGLLTFSDKQTEDLRKLNYASARRAMIKQAPRVKFNNARERYLTSEEAEGLRLACECSSNPQLKHIVGLLLLTGARKSELLNAEWQHIDMVKRSWKLPMTKNGRSRHVPLSQPAMDIIKQLPRFDGCPYLLPNPKTRLPYSDIKRGWQEARKLAGLDDLHLHDLRHSAASFMINARVDLYTVGKMIGHVSIASTTRYSHLANDTLMAAAEAGAAKLDVNWSQGV